MTSERSFASLIAPVLVALLVGIPAAARADESAIDFYHNARIVTVDSKFSIAEAMAVRDGAIVAVGTEKDVRRAAGENARRVDLNGRMVLPGLIDSHVHPTGASIYEFDHPVPEMETIADVLKYIHARSLALPRGEWIKVEQVFVTRLRDQRFPTRKELDSVAPDHPVVFLTWPDASLNSAALKELRIDRDYRIPEGQTGKVERDDAGNPTGMLRNCAHIFEFPDPRRAPDFDERVERLRELLADYNRVGITSIVDRDAHEDGIEEYAALRERGKLTCRVYLSFHIDGHRPLDEVEKQINRAAEHKLRTDDELLRLGGVKAFLDGGMLTGSAFLREPWGVSRIYSITDPEYRGLLLIPPEHLERVVRMTFEKGLQFTAHSVGDGAVHTLLDAYRRVLENGEFRDLRPCLTHANFMSAEAIAEMRALGVSADLQPAWLLLDGKTLLDQFGETRLRYFQPYRSLFDAGVVVGGGSDHMQKVGSLRSVNPYNPFLGMWITLARQPRRAEQPLHPEERITRAEAIRLYTANNAYLTRDELRKGSLEPGKLADFIVIDRNLLSCPVEAISETRVERTYLGGRLVYSNDG